MRCAIDGKHVCIVRSRVRWDPTKILSLDCSSHELGFHIPKLRGAVRYTNGEG